MRYLFHILIVAALTSVACGGGGPTNPSGTGSGGSSGGSGGCGGGGTTLPNGSMSARIDGTLWNATVGILVTNTSTGGVPIISISGGDAVRSIAFAASPARTGVFTISSLTMGCNFGLVQGNQRWNASDLDRGSSGTLTFTTLTSNGATGTFSFVGIASASSAATGTRTITDGVFNVTF